MFKNIRHWKCSWKLFLTWAKWDINNHASSSGKQDTAPKGPFRVRVGKHTENTSIEKEMLGQQLKNERYSSVVWNLNAHFSHTTMKLQVFHRVAPQQGPKLQFSTIYFWGFLALSIPSYFFLRKNPTIFSLFLCYWLHFMLSH